MSKHDHKKMLILLNNLVLLISLLDSDYQRKCFLEAFRVNDDFEEFIANKTNINKIFHFVKLLELKIGVQDLKFNSKEHEKIFVETCIKLKKIIKDYLKHPNLESEIENHIYSERSNLLFA